MATLDVEDASGHVDLKRIIASDEYPENLRLRAIDLLVSQKKSLDDAAAASAVEDQRLKLERAKMWLNAPFLASALALAAIGGNYLSTLWVNQDRDIRSSESLLKLERTKFQFDLVKTALNEHKTPEERARALQFLQEVGFLEGLKTDALTKWANPEEKQLPSLSTSDRPGVEREVAQEPILEELATSLTTKAEANGSIQWMKLAIAEYGVVEIDGPDSNKRIMDYARETNQKNYDGDHVPWNALFLHWVLMKAGFENFPSPTLAGRNWLKWGTRLEQPEFGAIAIFRTKNPSSLTSSVGFITSFDDDEISILGGNVRNAVEIMTIPKERLLGIIKPSS